MTVSVMKRGRPKTDWWRVLVDLQYAGVTHAAVCRAIGVPRSTLTGWKNGSEPSYGDGWELLELWMAATGKTFADRPLSNVGIPSPKA